jgi:hypothetical protein
MKNLKEKEMQMSSPRATLIGPKRRNSFVSKIGMGLRSVSLNSGHYSPLQTERSERPPSPTGVPSISPLSLSSISPIKDRITQRFRRGSISPTLLLPLTLTPRKEFQHIMLIGALGCGKSTFYKQLGMNTEDCLGQQDIIYTCIVDNLQIFCQYFKEHMELIYNIELLVRFLIFILLTHIQETH